MQWTKTTKILTGIVAVLAVVGGAIRFVAEVSYDQVQTGLKSWLKPFAPIADALGGNTGAYILWGLAALAATATLWLMFRHKEQKPAPPADNDHWTERKQAELSILANVSAGRAPEETPIDKGHAWSRLRELKDAIALRELDAELRGEHPNVNSVVTLAAFRLYVAATNKPYWAEVLQRWEARQARSPAFSSDWRMGEAMDYVAEILGTAAEQDLGKKYAGPAAFLTRKLRAGEIRAWGRRVRGDGAELAQREFKAAEWDDIELSIWACQPYTRKTQTQSASNGPVQLLTDLHVSEAQVKAVMEAEIRTFMR